MMTVQVSRMKFKSVKNKKKTIFQTFKMFLVFSPQDLIFDLLDFNIGKI